MIKGIYQIKNNLNSKIYIGSSKDIMKRWERHIKELNNHTHHSYKLQNDWLKYNYTDFSFSIIEIVYDEKKLLEREQFYIDQYENDELYNVNTYTKYNNNIPVPESFINNLEFMDKLDQLTINKLKHNLNIFTKVGKIKEMGKKENDLSKAWFSKNQKEYDQLKFNILNYFAHYCKAKSKNIAWTTFTQYYHQLKYKGFINSFVPLNGELMNNISKRNYLCFAANCFPNSFVKRKSNLEVDNNTYALSILLNWIINVSDIDKPIHIYLPSKRMENILREWLINN